MPSHEGEIKESIKRINIFPSLGMVGEACLPINASYPRTPDYTLYSGVHVCWSEHSDSSFVYGFMSLIYGLDTMTTTTSDKILSVTNHFFFFSFINKNSFQRMSKVQWS